MANYSEYVRYSVFELGRACKLALACHYSEGSQPVRYLGKGADYRIT